MPIFNLLAANSKYIPTILLSIVCTFISFSLPANQVNTAFQQAITAEKNLKLDRAIILYQKTISSQTSLKEKTESYYGLIRVYQKLNRGADAFKTIKQLEDFSANIKDELTLMRNYRTIAIAYQSVGENELARDYYAVAVEIARDQKDKLALANLLNEQAYADTLIPDISSAIITFKESKSIYRTLERKKQFIDVSLNQIQAEILSSNKEDAISGLNDLKIYFPNKTKGNVTSSQLIRLGLLYRAAQLKFNLNGTYREQSYSLYIQAKTKAQTNNELMALSYAQGYIGQLYSDEGRYADAITYTRRALHIAENHNAFALQYKWLLQLARSTNADKNHAESIFFYGKAIDLLPRIGIKYFTQKERKIERDVAPVFNEYYKALLLNALAIGDKHNEQEQEKKQIEFRKVLQLTHLLQQYRRDAKCKTLCGAKTINKKIILPAGQVLIAPFLFEDQLISLAVIESRIEYSKIKITADFFLLKKAETTESSPEFYQWIVEPFIPYFDDIKTISFLRNGLMEGFSYGELKTGNRYIKNVYQITQEADVYDLLLQK